MPLRLGREFAALKAPAAVLPALQRIIQRDLNAREPSQRGLNLRVGAVWYEPENVSDIAALVLGKTLFMADDLPAGAIWREFQALVGEQGGEVGPLADFGRRQTVPFTLTEALSALHPGRGEERLSKMLQRHGIRDALFCPFRGWTLGFWSGKVIKPLPVDVRTALFMAAAGAVGRIATLVKKPQRRGTAVKLTDREKAALRLATYGNSVKEIAARLEIKPTTAQTHLKNAVRKLKARNRLQAAVEAVRQGLID